jgi:hypothetical protein
MPIQGTTAGTLLLKMVNGTGTADTDGTALVNVPYTAGQTYTIPPRVVSITRAGPNPAGATVNYTVPSMRQ